jgi:hypothetical protein
VDLDGGQLGAEQARRFAVGPDGHQRDLGHPGECLRVGDALVPSHRVDRRPQQSAVLGVQPGAEAHQRVGTPSMGHPLAIARRCRLLDVVDRPQSAHDVLEMADGAVLGHDDQLVDQLFVAQFSYPADRAHLGVGEPAGRHLGAQTLVAREAAGDPDVVARCAPGEAAVVREPAGGRRQPEVLVSGALIEAGDQQQPAAGGRGEPAGQADDA